MIANGADLFGFDFGLASDAPLAGLGTVLQLFATGAPVNLSTENHSVVVLGGVGGLACPGHVILHTLSIGHA